MKRQVCEVAQRRVDEAHAWAGRPSAGPRARAAPAAPRDSAREEVLEGAAHLVAHEHAGPARAARSVGARVVGEGRRRRSRRGTRRRARGRPAGRGARRGRASFCRRDLERLAVGDAGRAPQRPARAAPKADPGAQRVAAADPHLDGAGRAAPDRAERARGARRDLPTPAGAVTSTACADGSSTHSANDGLERAELAVAADAGRGLAEQRARADGRLALAAELEASRRAVPVGATSKRASSSPAVTSSMAMLRAPRCPMPRGGARRGR